jgi:hypothetical protein
MDEELEKKIGKIVISISQAFLKVLYIYLRFLLIAIILLSVFWALTLIVGAFCLAIEGITGVDTTSFRANYLTMPVNGLVWVLDKCFIVLFVFFLTNKTGIFMLIMTVLGISFFEYKKRTKT